MLRRIPLQPFNRRTRRKTMVRRLRRERSQRLVHHVLQSLNQPHLHPPLHFRSSLPFVTACIPSPKTSTLFSRYTLPFLYYSFTLLFLAVLRPFVLPFEEKQRPGGGRTSCSAAVYAALYFLPVITLVHGVFAGLLCKRISALLSPDFILLL